MAIIRINFHAPDSTQQPTDLALVICQMLKSSVDCAYLFGGEITSISPRQRVQALPVRLAKVLSELSRRGFAFCVATENGEGAIFFAKNLKILQQHTGRGRYA